MMDDRAEKEMVLLVQFVGLLGRIIINHLPPDAQREMLVLQNKYMRARARLAEQASESESRTWESTEKELPINRNPVND